MNEFYDRLIFTLNPSHDTTVPDRGVSVASESAYDALIAGLMWQNVSLAEILVDLAKECRELLWDQGAILRPLSPTHPGYFAFVLEDLMPAASWSLRSLRNSSVDTNSRFMEGSSRSKFFVDA